MKKGLEAEITMHNTPNFSEDVNKPLLNKENRSRKVDINILKARAQEIKDKENRKNIFIFIFFLFVLGTIGIYLSI